MGFEWYLDDSVLKATIVLNMIATLKDMPTYTRMHASSLYLHLACTYHTGLIIGDVKV